MSIKYISLVCPIVLPSSSLVKRSLIIIIITIIYLNCKWVFTQWQWYYNKTQDTNTHVTQNNTPRSNRTLHTKHTKNEGYITQNEYYTQITSGLFFSWFSLQLTFSSYTELMIIANSLYRCNIDHAGNSVHIRGGDPKITGIDLLRMRAF
jgi:hypothetical protein